MYGSWIGTGRKYIRFVQIDTYWMNLKVEKKLKKIYGKTPSINMHKKDTYLYTIFWRVKTCLENITFNC